MVKRKEKSTMCRVKLRTRFAHPKRGTAQPGDTITLPRREAEELIAAGCAVEVAPGAAPQETPKKTHAKKPRQEPAKKPAEQVPGPPQPRRGKPFVDGVPPGVEDGSGAPEPENGDPPAGGSPEKPDDAVLEG